MKLKYKKLLNKSIVIGILILFIIFFSLLKLNENIAEYFYARGISRAYIFIMGNISDIFDFSVFELFVLCAVVALIACVTVFFIRLRKKQRTEAVALLERTIIAALSIALIYVITASGCYYRKEMPIEKYEGEQLTTEETCDVILAYLIDFSEIANSLTYNDDGKSVCPYSFDELNEMLATEYTRLTDNYYSDFTPKAKSAISSELMSYGGTCGITFLPLGEATVNTKTPDCYLVLTIAHELAHTKGVMRERDANLLAYYLLASSDVPYFRYCSYMYGLSYLTGILYNLDSTAYKQVMQNYPEKARIDRNLENLYWQEKEGVIEDISQFFNDLYLKLSGVKNGTNNYTDPSTITHDTVIIDDEPVVTVKVTYSDTAKMFIALKHNK